MPDPNLCPVCGKGNIEIVADVDRTGDPGPFLETMLGDEDPPRQLGRCLECGAVGQFDEQKGVWVMELPADGE